MSLSSRKNGKVKVEIYSKTDCHLCDLAKETILSAGKEFDLDLEVIDITEDNELYEMYKEQIPVVFINGRKAFKYRVDPSKLRGKLRRNRFIV